MRNSDAPHYNPVRLRNFATDGLHEKINDTEVGVGGSHRIDVGFLVGVVFFFFRCRFSVNEKILFQWSKNPTQSSYISREDTGSL